MGTAAKLYLGIIILLAGGIVASLPDPTLAIPLRDALNLGAFLAIGVLAEAMATDFRVGSGRQAKSSLAFLPFLSSLVLFPLGPAVAIVGFVVAISQFILRRNEFLRASFNVSMAIISATLGGWTYALFANPEPGNLAILGFFALAAVFFSTNMLLTSLALALMRGQPLRDVLSQVTGPRGANLWYDLLASPIALMPVALYDQLEGGGLVLVTLPLLLIRYSYLSKLQLEESNRDLLKVLVKAIETRDPYTSGHSLRVAMLARAIAEDLGQPKRHVERIETAALLHDIGKIDSVYEAVIRKPYDLNATERELIRTHATKGADLLESLSSVSAEIIRAVRHTTNAMMAAAIPVGSKEKRFQSMHASSCSATRLMLCFPTALTEKPCRLKRLGWS